MMPLCIKTIPHKKQRYDTVGDWYAKKNIQYILVSDMKNEEYEFLVALHELLEWFLCKKRGIKEKDVDAFDKNWKSHHGIEEAGNDPKSPYHKEHAFALRMERMIAKELQVHWSVYEEALESL